MTTSSECLADRLRRKAIIYEKIREYFDHQRVTQVYTPLLTPYGATDPSISNLLANEEANDGQGEPVGYLQSSPEFAMKRLLAAGSGDIYQLGPAFRGGEHGRHHRREFTILEWYRENFDHHQLMDDVQALVSSIVENRHWRRCTYRDLFLEYLGFDPATASDELLFARASLSLELTSNSEIDRSLFLDVIFSQQVQPALNKGEAIFVYDFAPEQSAYAKIRVDEAPPVASRFELIIDGIELANGYHEVTDRSEQLRRHTQEQRTRRERELPDVVIDPDFIAAFDRDMPETAGVALGVNRLMMLAFGVDSIADLEPELNVE